MFLRQGLAIGLAAALAGGGSARAETRTLIEALAAAYSNNPSLLAARAQLRSVDENVPAALAGWRPQVSLTGNAGREELTNTTQFAAFQNPSNYQPYRTNTTSKAALNTTTGEVTVTQPLWRGGQTRATTNHAENQVMGQRARLIAAEEQVFTDTVNAFVSVIGNQEVLALDVNNEQVLARQLQATNDRFRVGEITRTDVAQAEAALAGATATRQTAEGNLQTARAQFQRMVGELPGALIEPQPLRLPVSTLEEAKTLSEANNPNVVAALFDDAAAKDNFDLQFSKLMPNVSLQGSVLNTSNVSGANELNHNAQIVASVTFPLYQGGSEYAAIRQARQQQQQARRLIDDARRTAVQNVISAWETYNAARSSIESTRSQIRANRIALEGVQREAIVGSRTTLDVLNAEQLLLTSRVTLVQNLVNLVSASYAVAAAVGRLTARDLALPVPLYDETAYYKAVRNRWIGTGDYAINQPGR
jgi:outer membrane protein